MALSGGGPQPRGACVPGAPAAQGGAEKKHQPWPPLWEHLPGKVANQEDSSGERESRTGWLAESVTKTWQP